MTSWTWDRPKVEYKGYTIEVYGNPMCALIYKGRQCVWETVPHPDLEEVIEVAKQWIEKQEKEGTV